EAVRTARGSHVCLLDHGDLLEPQALHRFAEAILKDDADLLYGDGVVVGDDPDEPLAVQALPQFSYDLYLSHTYFRHATAVRTSLLRQAAPGETAEGGWEVDTVLRVLEGAERVGHIPDLLYRRRPRIVAGPPGKQAECKAVAAHLRRLGWDAEVEP